MNEVVAAPRARPGAADRRPDLVAAARALAPKVRERARTAENLRRLPDETVREYEAAALCKVWIPKRYGGLEADLHTGLDTMFEVARGCASSSWCLTVWQQHSWIVGHFPEAAQTETLSAEPDFHIAAVLSPRGKARRVEGGYRLSGLWPFGSGSDHGTWILLGGLVVDEDGEPVPIDREIFGVPAANARLFLLPMADVVNRGDWDVAGLAATGSNSIAVDDIFVPDHRTLFIPDAVEGKAPGRDVHDGDLFRATYYSFLHTALCGPAPGVAQGALDELLTYVDKRIVLPANRIQSTMERTHRQVAEAEAKIQMARLLLRDAADRIMDAAAAGRQLSMEERAICRRNGVLSTHLSYEATEIVFFAGGGSQLSMKSPLQRAMRDMHAIKAHYFMDLDTALELSGMIRLGKTPYSYVF